MRTLEKQPFCVLPSPIHRAARLEVDVGLRAGLYLKRDDLLGRVFGGNKLRKLEFIVHAATAAGADSLVTCGAFESNHAALTSCVARMMAWRATVVLMGSGDDVERSSNERLLDLTEADVRRVRFSRGDVSSLATARLLMQKKVDEAADEIIRQGGTPYVVPEGGACLEGSYAFVEAFREVQSQMATLGHERFDIVLPVGTGSTFAGLWCGILLESAPVGLYGISIAHPELRAKQLARRATIPLCRLLGTTPPSVDELSVSGRYRGDAYGERTAWSKQAVDLALSREGVLLDHTYTGKAFGGLIRMLDNDYRPKWPVVFWVTGGIAGAIDQLWRDERQETLPC